ncbi:MAG: 6,7-dimethyl-8-ribityllumazine synthase, partial [Flavobacteriales bacterium]
MATENLSAYNKEHLPDAHTMRIGIVVSEWNDHITSGLLKGCVDALNDCGVPTSNVMIAHVPGSFELPLGAQLLFENNSLEAVVCLGCVIRGETAHFDFVCQACATGIQSLSLKLGKPVIFGVLTDDNEDQSIARSGGNKGNKGTEAAITAIKMIGL